MHRLLEKYRNHQLFHTYPITKQFIKYSLIGVVVTLIDFLTYISLTRTYTWWQEHFLLANIVAFTVAVTVSFFANRKWTFREHESSMITQYPKFLFVNIFALSLSQLVLYALVTGFLIHDIIAKIIASIAVIILRFLLYKYWIFK